MFRNNFEPELARLVREQTTKDKIARAMQEFVSQQDDELDQAEGAIIALDSLPKSTPSYIKRFIDIDRAWNSERIKTYLSYIITESLDDQIAKFQKIVDDNAPDSGTSSRKERRRKREQELRLPGLMDLLAARALRAVEHERGIVALDEVQSMPGPEPKSLDIQRWPHTSFNTDRLKARREFRLKTEKAEAVAAKKEFNGKIRAELNGKRKKGHWEFKTEEDEVVARVLMRNFETIKEEAFARVYMESTKEGAITADSVVAKVKAKKEPSVLQEIGIVWVEDEAVNVRKRKREPTSDMPTRRAKVPKLTLTVRLPISITLTDDDMEGRMSLDGGSDSELTEFTEGSDGEDMVTED